MCVCPFSSLLSSHKTLSEATMKPKENQIVLYPTIIMPFTLMSKILVNILPLYYLPMLLVATAAVASTPMDTSSASLINVDQSGNGDFRRIQDAIDSVPPGNSQHVYIRVQPGTYREKIVIPSNKPYITIRGTKASNTIITWSDSGDIFTSPTVSVLASDFVGQSLTILNTFGTSGKAVALRVAGDRAAFYNCRIISYQDTILDDFGKHYYYKCYIEGGTDFICGNGASLFENCHLHSTSEANGAITAQHRESPSEDTGFVFLNCKITGVKTAFLGRPWGAYSRVVFLQTYMSRAILPQGWDDWGATNRHSTVYYGEYQCYGPGADRTGRAEWSRSLTSSEANHFLTMDVMGGRDWLRTAAITHFKTRRSHFRTRGSAVAAFRSGRWS